MSRLADFGRQGSGGSGESIKKIKSVTKIFRKMLNEVLKSCQIISADVKADVKQQEMQEIVAVFVFFYKKHLQNLKYNIPLGMYFSFNFAWDSIQLGLVR